jgi:hypothetical protein
MRGYVVDTNVPVVANGRNEQADPDCVIACIDSLANVREHGVVVLDGGMQILYEYMRNISMSGQPGPGDLFMKWVWTVQADVSRCERVQLTLREGNSGDFAEFPDDADLIHFDRSDRKFVAVALKSANKPEVLNAVDSDWSIHHAALERAGVSITFLCPQHVCPAR